MLSAVLGGGDGGAALWPVGGAGVPVCSVGGVEGLALGGGGVVVARVGGTVDVAEVRLGRGDGLTERASRIGWSWPRSVGWRTIAGLLVAAPAPPPSSVGVALGGRCELTAAGVPLVGTATTVAS